MSSSEQILANQFKQAMGAMQHLDFTDSDAISAHHRLGQEDVREQTWRFLGKRLDDFGEAGQIEQQMRLARRAQKALEARLHSQLGGEAAYAYYDVKAYIVCQMCDDTMRIWVGNGTPCQMRIFFIWKALERLYARRHICLENPLTGLTTCQVTPTHKASMYGTR